VLTFGPFAILAWMMLDRYSINRFSIGYCPLFAILAADGIRRITRKWPRAEPVIGSALVAYFFFWTLPALATVRNTVAPSVLAVEAVKQQLDPRIDKLLVARDMDPFFQYLLPGYPYVHVLDKRAMPLSVDGRRAWILAEADLNDHDGYVFHRQRGHLWNIARRHYFDAGLIPVRTMPQFLDGWDAPTREGPIELRSMAAHSVIRLPPATGETILRIEFRFPPALLTKRAIVSIALNGYIVDRFTPSIEDDDREYHVKPAPNGMANMLELSADGPGIAVKCLSFGPE
jgi:hypothetical protein